MWSQRLMDTRLDSIAEVLTDAAPACDIVNELGRGACVGSAGILTRLTSANYFSTCRHVKNCRVDIKVKSKSKQSMAVSDSPHRYGITQYYLPPGRGDIPAVTPAEAGTRLSDPEGMQG